MVTPPIARAPTPSIAGQNREEAARGTFRSSVGRPRDTATAGSMYSHETTQLDEQARSVTVDCLFMGERNHDVSITRVERAKGTVRTGGVESDTFGEQTCWEILGQDVRFE